LDARLTTLLCKQIIVAKSKEVKTGCNLAESSRQGYGSKSAGLPMMMMIFERMCYHYYKSLTGITTERKGTVECFDMSAGMQLTVMVRCAQVNVVTRTNCRSADGPFLVGGVTYTIVRTGLLNMQT
jgi:hypothetical protein